jgi:glutamate dehydrogenase
MHNSLLKELERNAGLDPAVEYLPDGEEVALRVSAKQGFTRPELAVLMAYAKIQLKKQLLQSSVPDESFVLNDLINYFPKPLHDPKFITFMNEHGLRRDIIATQISNYIVNEMGINFMQRLAEESGVETSQLARAYLIARDVFDVQHIQSEIRSLGCKIPMSLQITMWLDLNRLVRRSTRWFARNLRGDIDIEKCINIYKPKVLLISENIYTIMRGATLAQANEQRASLLEAGVPEILATKVAIFYGMFTALDIVQANIEYGFDIMEVGEVYFEIGTKLDLEWLGELIKKQPVYSYWEALARAVFRDDIEKQQRNLSVSILSSQGQQDKSITEMVESWMKEHSELLIRWNFLISELKTSEPSFTMFAIAIREMLDVSRAVKEPTIK